MQIQSTVGDLVAKWTTSQRIGLCKNWRADYADGRSLIDVVKNVARGNAQGQAVALPGRVAPAKHPSAAPIASATAAGAARPAAESTAGRGTGPIVRSADCLFSESKSLAYLSV